MVRLCKGPFIASEQGVLMEAKIQAPPQQEDIISLVDRVVRIVSSVRGTKSDYALLATELAPIIPFDLFGIVLLRHDRQAVRVVVCTRETGEWVSHYHQHPLADSMLERILHTDVRTEPDEDALNPVPTHASSAEDALEMAIHTYPDGLDGTPSECGDALSGYPHLHSTLIAPLIVGNRVLGSLELGSIEKGVYNDERVVRLIPAVARVLAAAIENAQVGGNLEIQDRQRQELHKVSSALTSKMDLATILYRIVDGIAKALNVASAIVMIDRHTGRLRLDAQHGLAPEALQKLVNLKLMLTDNSIIGFTLRRGQPTVSNDIAQDERFPGSQVFAIELGMHSIFSYPLVVGSTVSGALLLFSPEPGGFTPLKTDILSLFASQAMIAIHNGMLLESVRERRRFQDAIEQLEKTTQNTLAVEDEQAMLRIVRKETERNFGVSFTSLLRFISSNLLTRSERDLQSMLYAIETEHENGSVVEADDTGIALLNQQKSISSLEKPLKATNVPASEDSSSNEGSATTLMRSAEAALARAGLLGDVGAAFTAMLDPDRTVKGTSDMPRLYERVTRGVQDPWFIVDLLGHCIYVNPAAEALCGMRLDLDTLGNVALEASFFEPHVESPLQFTQGLTLPEALVRLLPRIRKLDDVLDYLQEFVYADMSNERSAEMLQHIGEDSESIPRLHPLPRNTLRCVIAAEPLQRDTPLQDETGGLSDGQRMETSITPTGRDSMYRVPPSHPLHTKSPAMLLDNAPSDRHYQFMRYALYDQDNELIAHALQIHDITEQVRDEKNKSALLSSVSHDLRTPLTSIKAAVSGLLQPDVEWDEKTRREMLEDIDAEADHLNVLINSMVEMSRIEMGALALEKEWCDLVEIVHSSLSRFEHAFQGYHVRTEFQPSLPLIQVDYLQLKRVFYNLLENAVRHTTKESGILITAHTVAWEMPGDTVPDDAPRYLRVQVIDHGKGVPEEERERIFKSFYSLDGHTGLGLTICRGIIEAHHGRIWVESAPGGGACFVIVLPVSA